jgi:hypothetical protein
MRAVAHVERSRRARLGSSGPGYVRWDLGNRAASYVGGL